MHYRRFSLGIGFLVWFFATIAFRVAGEYFFLTQNNGVMVSLYVAVVPALGFITHAVFNRLKLNKLQGVQAAVLMVLPGMFFDTFCIEMFDVVFPNLPPADAGSFAAWLMWSYMWVLLFGVLRKDREE